MLQADKTTTIFTQNDKFVAALSENDFQFVEFAKALIFSSQLEVNHVIHQPIA